MFFVVTIILANDIREWQRRQPRWYDDNLHFQESIKDMYSMATEVRWTTNDAWTLGVVLAPTVFGAAHLEKKTKNPKIIAT
jgi:hypothetical protein